MANENKQNQIQIEVPADEMQGMTPENAKQLLIALNENVRKYEQAFGEIKPRQAKNGTNPGIMDFPLPKGQA